MKFFVVQASITANTYVISGNAQTKSTFASKFEFSHGSGLEVSDLLPGIITQMGPESLASLKRVAEQMQVSTPPSKLPNCHIRPFSSFSKWLKSPICRRLPKMTMMLKFLSLWKILRRLRLKFNRQMCPVCSSDISLFFTKQIVKTL